MNSLRLLSALTCALAASAAGAFPAEPVDHWTPLTISANALKSVSDLIHVNGEFWGVGSTGRIQHSADGADWQVVQTPASDLLLSIAHGNGRFVAVGRQGAIVSSPNGIDWTLHEQPGSGHYMNQVIFADGTFVAAGKHLADGDWHGDVRISTNGTDWTPVSLDSVNSDFHAEGIAWGNGQFVLVGQGPSGWPTGEYSVMTSLDAVTWTRQKVEFYNNLYAVAYIDGMFVAGGLSFLATSPDGVTWTKVTSVEFPYTNMDIWGIKPINGRLFVFGDYGLLLSSANGLDWTVHASGTTKDIAAMAYDGNRVLMFRTTITSSSTNGPAVSDPWAPVSGGTEPGDPGDPGYPADPGVPAGSAKIANISTRAWVGTDATQLITGFVIQGSAPKELLVRAVGPTLGSFGVGGTLADPQVTLFDGAGTAIASNNDWGAFANQAALAARTTQASAFALNSGSKDAAMVVTLAPGSYTLHTGSSNGGTGVALAEVYDGALSQSCRLVNISSRGFIGTGDSVAIPGFVVAGDQPKKLLVRGVGPTLSNYGVPAVLADPKVTLYDAAQSVVAENNDWHLAADQAALLAATGQVGAFALTANSADAALVVTVPPGSYTAIVSGLAGATGVALVEIYEVE